MPTIPTSPLATPPAEAEQAIRLARQDLAGRLTLAAEAAQLVSVEAVDWPDASLGCPQPGMMYAQVVTPGYRVVLAAAGGRYEYHSDSGRRVVYCQPAPTRLAPGAVETESVMLARQDLARRTGVSVEDVRVLAVIGQEFSAAAFDCRASKERVARDEAPAVVQGQAILLSAAGRRYEYHASGEKVIFCRELR
jgi:hypothetical protein